MQEYYQLRFCGFKILLQLASASSGCKTYPIVVRTVLAVEGDRINTMVRSCFPDLLAADRSKTVQDVRSIWPLSAPFPGA